MNNREVLQTACRYCSRVVESESLMELIRKVEEHEQQCPKKPKDKA